MNLEDELFYACTNYCNALNHYKTTERKMLYDFECPESEKAKLIDFEKDRVKYSLDKLIEIINKISDDGRMVDNKGYRKVMGMIENTAGGTFDLTEIENLLNEQEERIRELENSKKQLKRVYNYFMDYLEDEMSGNSFSEMWDFVITDEKWD